MKKFIIGVILGSILLSAGWLALAGPIQSQTGGNVFDIINRKWGSLAGIRGNQANAVMATEAEALIPVTPIFGRAAASTTYTSITSASLLSTLQGLDTRSFVFATDGSAATQIRGDSTNGLDVDVVRLPDIGIMISNAFTNVTTNTSTLINNSNATLYKINVNVAGTTSNVRIFNDSSAPCDSGFVAQMDTTLLGNPYEFNHLFNVGICVLTAGAAAADITVFYRDVN